MLKLGVLRFLITDVFGFVIYVIPIARIRCEITSANIYFNFIISVKWSYVILQFPCQYTLYSLQPLYYLVETSVDELDVMQNDCFWTSLFTTLWRRGEGLHVELQTFVRIVSPSLYRFVLLPAGNVATRFLEIACNVQQRVALIHWDLNTDYRTRSFRSQTHGYVFAFCLWRHKFLSWPLNASVSFEMKAGTFSSLRASSKSWSSLNTKQV